MAAFPNNRFFTPPKLSPLGLDVASLGGGGYAPAQFWGKTHDGRQVYCRYRGGCLSVWLADAPGSDPYMNGTCLLEERIGPRLHGGLSLGQLLRYTGITVNGTIPELGDEEEMPKEDWLDLSGNSTHYNFTEYSTPETAQRLFNELSLEVPSANENHFDWHFIVDDAGAGRGIKPKSIVYAIETQVKQCTPLFQLRYFGFQRCPSFSSTAATIFERDLGLRLKTAGEDESCRFDTLFVWTSFPADNRKLLNRTVRVDQILNRVFPVTQFVCFDLKQRVRLPEKDYDAPLDPAIRKWILAANDRWRWVHYGHGDKNKLEYLGYRPKE